MIILSFRPFDNINPYSETGPIFLCGKNCVRHVDSKVLPAMFRDWDKTLIRSYNNDGRIVYGTGAVIEMSKTGDVARQIFSDSRVTCIHMRSASYNCYQCRIERAAA